VTLICAYFQPEYPPEGIIDTLSEVINKIKELEKVILAGDMNNQVDKRNKKSDLVTAFLEKGLTSRDRSNMCSHNSSSTTDLMFKNKKLKIKFHKIKTISATAIRKLLSVAFNRQIYWQ
jgi:hypothetical protein